MSVTIQVNRSPITVNPTETPVTVSPTETPVTIQQGGGSTTIEPTETPVTINRGTPGFPSGGTTGQALVKASDTDYDYDWSTVSGGGGASFSATVTAGENLAARDLIYINASGQALKADADSATKWASGYVTATITSGNTGTAYFFAGIITGFTSLTPGALYYLSATAGGITATQPTSGIVQQVGRALSSTTLLFSPLHAIKI